MPIRNHLLRFNPALRKLSNGILQFPKCILGFSKCVLRFFRDQNRQYFAHLKHQKDPNQLEKCLGKIPTGLRKIPTRLRKIAGWYNLFEKILSYCVFYKSNIYCE